MRLHLCLAVLAVSVTVACALSLTAPPAAPIIASNRASYDDDLQNLKRVARQADQMTPPPPPPDQPPPPPQGPPPPPDGQPPPPPEGQPPPPPPEDWNPPPAPEEWKPPFRRRREAKGGGSMPTRKG